MIKNFKFQISNFKFALSLVFLILSFSTLNSQLSTIYAVDLGSQYGLAGGDFQNLGQVLGYLVAPAFNVAGISVTIYLLIGAFKYLTSGGDKQALDSARAMITHAIIGFVLLIVMFLALEFIPQFFGLEGFNLIKIN